MKKKIGLFMSFMLVAALAVGTTLAFLQDDLGSVTNKFTSDGNISGELTEPGWTNEFGTNGSWSNYLPGDKQAKDPQITINDGSQDAYVAIKVAYKVNGSFVSYTTFSDYVEITNGTNSISGMSSDWTLQNVTDTTNPNAQYYVYNNIMTAGSTTTPLFDNVKIADDIPVNTDGTLPTLEIVVSGHAVQADNNPNFATQLVDALRGTN